MKVRKKQEAQDQDVSREPPPKSQGQKERRSNLEYESSLSQTNVTDRGDCGDAHGVCRFCRTPGSSAGACAGRQSHHPRQGETRGQAFQRQTVQQYRRGQLRHVSRQGQRFLRWPPGFRGNQQAHGHTKCAHRDQCSLSSHPVLGRPRTHARGAIRGAPHQPCGDGPPKSRTHPQNRANGP